MLRLDNLDLILIKIEIIVQGLAFFLGCFTGVDEAGEDDQESVAVFEHEVEEVQVVDALTHAHFVVELVCCDFLEGIVDFYLEVGTFFVVFEWKHFCIAMREDLLQGVMIREMDLEIGLEFHILHKVFKFSFTELLIQWKLLGLLLQALLMLSLDNPSKNINKLKHTDLKENIQKSLIALEINKHKIAIQVIIKRFLLDRPIDNLLRHIFFAYFMRNFVFFASEVHF